MTAFVNHPLFEFEEAIKPFRETWRSVEIKAVCDSRNNKLLSMIACFTPDEPSPIETVDKVSEIALVRGALPVEELNRVLAGLRTGSIILGPYDLGTQEFERYEFRSLDRPRDEDLSRGWPELHGFSMVSAQAWGIRSLEAITTPRDLWAAARVQGFSSFPELCFHRLQFDVGGSKVLRVKLFAPVMINIHSLVENDRVQVQLRFPSALSADSLTLAYRVQDGRGNRLANGRKEASELERVTNNGWSSLGGSIPLPSGSARVELQAFSTAYRSGTEVVAAEFIEVPLREGHENPRWDVLRSLIANTRAWTKQASRTKSDDTLMQWLGLATGRPSQDDFERGVHCLLWLAGCPSLHIGPAEGVDLAIFFADTSKLAVLISCTTSPDLQPKFNTLLLQANRLRQTLTGTQVVAAVIAPVEQDDMTIRTAHEASESDIRLILLDQLKELCEKATGRDWETAYDTLVRYLEGPHYSGV